MPPVTWLISKKKNQVAGYESRKYLGMGYTFVKKKECNEYDLYNCANCKSVYEKKKKADEICPTVNCIKIQGDHFRSNPDDINHICIGDPIVDTRWSKIIAEHCY